MRPLCCLETSGTKHAVTQRYIKKIFNVNDVQKKLKDEVTSIADKKLKNARGDIGILKEVAEEMADFTEALLEVVKEENSATKLKSTAKDAFRIADSAFKTANKTATDKSVVKEIEKQRNRASLAKDEIDRFREIKKVK